MKQHLNRPVCTMTSNYHEEGEAAFDHNLSTGRTIADHLEAVVAGSLYRLRRHYGPPMTAATESHTQQQVINSEAVLGVLPVVFAV